MRVAKARYISLSHLLPSKHPNEVRLFVLATGRETSLECGSQTIHRIYKSILKQLEGTPKTKAEVFKSISQRSLDLEFAEQAFEALLRAGIIAEITRLASALTRVWQNPIVYMPAGYKFFAAARYHQLRAAQTALDIF